MATEAKELDAAVSELKRAGRHLAKVKERIVPKLTEAQDAYAASFARVSDIVGQQLIGMPDLPDVPADAPED